jgi:hypothetical protein
VDVVYGEVYWTHGGGGMLGLDTVRACWEWIGDWKVEGAYEVLWGGLNTGKGRWKCEFDLEVEEPGAEELGQGVYVIAPMYGLEYRSQHFRHGCVRSKFLKPVLLPMRNGGDEHKYGMGYWDAKNGR